MDVERWMERAMDGDSDEEIWMERDEARWVEKGREVDGESDG
jgi:hypothetical protein